MKLKPKGRRLHEHSPHLTLGVPPLHLGEDLETKEEFQGAEVVSSLKALVVGRLGEAEDQ